MPKTIYALLVGINEYLGGLPQLNGCTNDVERMQEFLEGRTQGGEYILDLQVLTSGDFFNPEEIKPTREAVIAGFRQHLGQASEGDVALFYYSGHGSQEKAPPEFWHLEPDHLDETLVLYDSRVEGGWDLADKELSVLIAELAQKGPHILVILDACHSGSGTRAAEGTGIRLAPLDARDRPLDSFLPGVVPAAAAAAPSVAQLKGQEAGGWYSLPQGRHVVISACRPEESAREKLMPGDQMHGVLSYYLLDTLQQSGPTLSYRDVFSRCNALVRSLVNDQNPVVAATDSTDLLQPFLGGAIVEQLPYYNVTFEKDFGWSIPAGAIHGIAQPSGGETTHLALFPLGYPVKPGSNLAEALGQAWVVEVQPSRACLELELAADLRPDPQQDSFRAVVVSTPLPPVGVSLSGDDGPGLERLRSALDSSLVVRPVEEDTTAAVQVRASQSEVGYRLKRAGDRQPLSVKVAGRNAPAAAEAVVKLEHIARWLQLLQLENKQSQLPSDAVRMEFFHYFPGESGAAGHSEPLTDPGEIRLYYDPQRGEKSARLQIKLTHTGGYPGRLFCMLVDLTEDFAIATDSALFGGGIWLEPGQEVWATNARNEKFIHVWVPKELQAQGITQVKDVLKLIVSTDESDASLLKQDGLEVVNDESTRGLEKGFAASQVKPSSLHRLMQRVQTRAVGALPEEEATFSDWRTQQVTITTAVLAGGADLPSGHGETVELAGGVRLSAHPELRARATLIHFEEGKRDLGNLALPAVFRQHPELSQPFEFLPSRGADAGASVIILSEVENPQVVTPSNPLYIRTQSSLPVDQAVLPLAYDPDTGLFLPLGLGLLQEGGVEIHIDRLPATTADSRSLGGSIKLFFQKVLVEKAGAGKLGLDGNLARLAAVSLDANGQVVYDASPISLKEKIHAADRILLYIHGFTGDTHGMAASAYGLASAAAAPLPRLVDTYDLILAFDYENINTPVEETAAKLKAGLVAAGLKPDHDKTLHIVAHSLGTQVARWFIERDSGARFVQRAVLAGPPNAGTPWAKIEEYILFALTAALNGLAAVLWPPSAIPILVSTLIGFVGGIEKIDTTLDQLKPDSPFYRVLNSSDDPHLPYVVIAGNTSKIVYAQSSLAEAEKGLLKKLTTRLASAETRDRLLSLAFFDAPNDMAISLQSMAALPPDRQPAPLFVEVPCDHISYFNTEIGLGPVIEGLLKD